MRKSLWFGSTDPSVRDPEQEAASGNYEAAFVKFKEIAEDRRRSNSLRAYCWAGMARMVIPCPWLGIPPDDCGYLYLVESTKLSPECGDAWIGILNTYGPYTPDHQDKILFEKAVDLISKLEPSQIPEIVREIYDCARLRHSECMPPLRAQ